MKKLIISSIIYCKTVPLEHLGTYACCKNCMSDFFGVEDMKFPGLSKK